MKVLLIKNSVIQNYVLPDTVSGNFWIIDRDNKGNKRYLINIDEYNGKWKLNSNVDTKIVVNNTIYQNILIDEYNSCFLNVKNEETSIILYFLPTIDNNFQKLDLNNYGELTIGSSPNNAITYNSPFLAPIHAKLTFQNGLWTIQNLDNKYGTYVNNRIINNVALSHGDIIFIMGLKIIVINNFILINNPRNAVTYNNSLLTLNAPLSLKQLEEINENDELDISLYTKDEYFFKEPRFKNNIEPIDIKIDPPPAKEKLDETPMIYTLGPMLTMGMTSAVMAFSSLNNVLNNKQDITGALPSLITSCAMLMSMLLWPLLLKRYQKNNTIKKEKIRVEKYSEYIEKKKKYILGEIENQKNILNNNYKSMEECRSIIVEKKPTLWERKIESDDFLTVRLGLGNIPPFIKIEIPEEHFTLDDDELKELTTKLKKECSTMSNVPVTFSLTEKFITSILGNTNLTKLFLDSIILQLMTFQSYDDFKIIVFTTKEKSIKWDYLKYSPHCWDNSKNIRYFGTTMDEIDQISNNLEEEFNQRRYTEGSNGDLKQNDKDYKSYSPYYLILTDDFDNIRNVGIIRNILSQSINYGFSLIINQENTKRLPNECTTFINIDKEKSTLLESSLYTNNQKEFKADFNSSVNMEHCSIKLSNIPIEFSKGAYDLPNMMTFLEMFNVGNIEQLNALNNWKTNDTTISLQTPVGVNQNGDLFKLDLHEKAHGPHGLIAGMTGSGKSEFIMTYILSMAVNYSPEEVAFVLIDYKGGGLAGAFKNNETGMQLPHLAGTITNLDTVEMKRSLASIQSELKKRQKIFNEARDIVGESTVDIYKYQRLYREGLVKKPVPHLLIISDEFAELKDQQPEFMEQLISTARIGRSLGVHLILATQKPSGVVDAQIWSNAKFRVCLKVQDKSDSMDMIKVADAASLKNPGRFYLQVGYNEFFALGQSAWCGAPYIPSDKINKKIDTSINFIDNIGNVIKSIDYKNQKANQKPMGEQLPNIVKYLSDLANKLNIKVDQLWLDKIPGFIYVDNLKKKYNYIAEKVNINPIIGEYDDPENQHQELLTLPLTKEGNTIIYGSTGSGKDILVSSIIYSSIIDHSVDEVNFYILDFGSETTRVFERAPHVGDILFINDAEKINNLFKMLKTTIEIRKNLFTEYNGDYSYYCKNSGNILPTIVVIVNNYEAFSETYNDYDEILLQLTREGTKYGIVFILTTNGVNSIRYRLSQNFKQNLVLQLNDEMDYTSVFGNIHGKYPSQIVGRGLVKLDNVYEFQSAYPYLKDKMSEFLKVVSLKLSSLYKTTAPRIPVLPEKVTYDFVSKDLKGLQQVPIGVEKQSLQISSFDFKSKYISLVTSQDIDTLKTFASSLTYELSKIDEINLIVVDVLDIIKDEVAQVINGSYIKDNYNEMFDKIYTYIENINKVYIDNNQDDSSITKYSQTLCVINGFADFKAKLSPELSNKIDSLFKNGKLTGKISFIFIDTIDKIKSIEYDPWFKECVTVNSGIWIGNGISEQFTLKLTKTTRDLYEPIDNTFGYLINKGVPTLVKLIEIDEIPKDDIEYIDF